MGLSFVRTIILYVCVIAAMRIMGKRTIGEMHPTELVVSIMISDLATVPMQSNATPLWDGIVPIFTLVALELIFAFLILKSRVIRRVLVGRSCRVVNNGKLMLSEMTKLRVTVDDIEEQIRIGGYTSLEDISEVVIETNGQVSVIPKSAGEKTPYIIIADGKLREKEMKKSGLNMDRINKEIRLAGGRGVKDILYMSAIDSRIVCVQKR